MRFKELAREVCRREGKRQQVNIAQVSEILKCLAGMIAERPFTVLGLLCERASKAKGKKK